MDFGKALDWLMLSPKYLLPILVAASILLFGSVDILASIGLEKFIGEYRMWVGVAWLASAALLASHLLTPLAKFLRRLVWEKNWIRHGKKRLQQLTPSEKEILRGFVLENTRSQYLDFQNGDVKGLEREKIIVMASNTGRLPRGFAYNIQPWAWEYLNENPRLLEQT